MTDTERLAWLQRNATRLKLQAGVASITYDPWEDIWHFAHCDGQDFPTLGEAIDHAAARLGGDS